MGTTRNALRTAIARRSTPDTSRTSSRTTGGSGTNRHRTSRSRDSCWGTSLRKEKSPRISLNGSRVGSESSRPRSSPSQRGGRGRNEPRSARRNHGSARSRKSSDEQGFRARRTFGTLMRHVRLPRPKTVATSKHRFVGGIFNGQARAAACRRLGRCPDHDQCNSRAGVRSAHERGTAGRVVGRRRPRRCPDRRGVRSDPSESTTRGDDHDHRGPPEALLCVAARERGSIRRDHGGVRTLSERAADRRARYPPLARNGGGGLGCHVAAGARLAEVLSRDAAAGIRWLSRTEGRGAEHFFNPSRFEVRGVSMPVSPIRKLNSIWVHVRDIKKARTFYHDVLGLSEIWYDEEGESASFRIPRGPPLSMHVQGKGELGRSAGTVSGIYFSVEDVKRAARAIERKGGTVPDRPEKKPWGNWNATIADPDGNEFVLTD